MIQPKSTRFVSTGRLLGKLKCRKCNKIFEISTNSRKIVNSSTQTTATLLAFFVLPLHSKEESPTLSPHTMFGTFFKQNVQMSRRPLQSKSGTLTARVRRPLAKRNTSKAASSILREAQMVASIQNGIHTTSSPSADSQTREKSQL